MTTNTLITKIDFKTNVHDVKLFARMIWQALFNEYHKNKGNLYNMDSFLCDLDTIERQLNNFFENVGLERESCNKLVLYVFYWNFHSKSGQTNLYDYCEDGAENQYAITIHYKHDSYYGNEKFVTVEKIT